MRMLFNHGLSADELFTNTPDRITTKNLQWFRNNYGHFYNREEGLSSPFRYCIGLILNKIIDEKVRFKIPVPSAAYIDFEVITEDLFEIYKQRGAFPEIDFIESDFTGYYLRYFYQSKSYQKFIPIHIGGDLKKKFISKINSGEKFYSIKDITLADVLDDVSLKFDKIEKGELKKILLHGFRRMHSSILYGCYISITAKKTINCYAFFGVLSTSQQKQLENYSFRIIKKLRMLDLWRRPLFDNYYYIGITPSLFSEWVITNKKNKVFSTFKNVMILRLQEEILTKAQKLYIFKFKEKKWRGYMFWKDEIKIRDVEYVGESYNGKLLPNSNKSWKQLIKEYEN